MANLNAVTLIVEMTKQFLQLIQSSEKLKITELLLTQEERKNDREILQVFRGLLFWILSDGF